MKYSEEFSKLGKMESILGNLSRLTELIGKIFMLSFALHFV